MEKMAISEMKFRHLELRNVTGINWNLAFLYIICSDYVLSRRHKDSLNIPIRCPKIADLSSKSKISTALLPCYISVNNSDLQTKDPKIPSPKSISPSINASDERSVPALYIYSRASLIRIWVYAKK